ncbi:MAG: 16S rRNA (uracil(1498)-N(3))-methyltransferase [Candidatus Woesearchaeota archaeon]
MNPNEYPWFYAPELPKSGEISLGTEEIRHMKAQRLKPEDKVSLFNGKGIVAICSLAGEGKARLIEVHEVPKGLFSLFIAVSVPKGERADWMLQKLAELGVSKIIPLKTERSVVLPREAKQGRWQRILIEACKQSKQAWLPELKPLSTIEQSLKEQAELKLMLDPEGKPLKEVLQQMPKSVLAFVGPEGGFTDKEKTALKNAGCIPVSLGKQILRTETAAMTITALLNILKK